ncbi:MULTISPECIES: M16 family metallopeptidase [Prochlorococcus]|uniref:M16 family metallopeptidase n=1 Tax=Prochlorococcus TaxID=1218 RepID=UPI000533808D|nr:MULTISPECIES: pitrilysin family protein [Prochlorococcus]KGG12327.1 Mitochondrial processing peptidase-like protein [Prochlorococcus sp. MIT 0601]
MKLTLKEVPELKVIETSNQEYAKKVQNGTSNKSKKLIQGPTVEMWSLDNGARCVSVFMKEAPITCIDFWCKAGSSFEKKGEEGMAHFLEHMIFKGTNQLKEGEFDLKIEALGGASNAATGLDDVHFYVLVPSENVEQAVQLLTHLVLSPSINHKAFNLERDVVLEEIAQSNDQPEDQIFEIFLENCWEEHPYGRRILGNPKSLRNITPNSLRKFHRNFYRANNITLSIAGEIPSNIKEIINNTELSKLTSQQNLEAGETLSKQLIFCSGHKEIEIRRLESARILMAWPIPPASDQMKIMGYDIATTILGEGRRSRLVHKLREELQIVESIDVDITALEQGGIVILEACCIESNLREVEDEINKILKDSFNNPPSEKELKRACQLVQNSLCFGLELPSQVASLAGVQALWSRNQPLLKPLEYVSTWSSNLLTKNIFNHLKPELGFTLLAKPKGKN